MKRIASYLLITLLAIAMIGCSGGGAGDSEIPAYTLIAGFTYDGEVQLWYEGGEVTDATVTVNGDSMPYDSMFGVYYLGNAEFNLSYPDTLDLRIVHGSLDRTLSLPMPAPVNITSPASGASVDVSEDLVLTWTRAAVPSRQKVTIEDTYTASGTDYNVSLKGDKAADTSFTIPGGTIMNGLDPVEIKVGTYSDWNTANDADFTGNSEFDIKELIILSIKSGDL